MKERYIATVDLGTGKLALSVARVLEEDVEVLYYRERPSDGMRYGRIFNPLLADKRAGLVKTYFKPLAGDCPSRLRSKAVYEGRSKPESRHYKDKKQVAQDLFHFESISQMGFTNLSILPAPKVTSTSSASLER
jgi:hypothetical protein